MLKLMGKKIFTILRSKFFVYLILCFRYQRKELVKREDSKYFANMIRKMKYKTMDHRMVGGFYTLHRIRTGLKST